MTDAKKIYTWSEVRTKIRRDLDLESETFVREEELRGYVNEAIDEAEAEIIGLYEDYFLDYYDLTLVSGTEEYDLPTDIFAHKIRRITYNNGSSVYTVNRIQDWKKFEDHAIATNFNTSDLYQYFIINRGPTEGVKILLVPKARESGQFLRVWFLRNANRIEADTDVIDIPEFINFIYQYLKVRIYEKEGHPNLPVAAQMLQQQRSLLQGTLTAAQPDAQNEIEHDTSFYEEMN